MLVTSSDFKCFIHTFDLDGLRPVLISVLFEPPGGDCGWEIAPIFTG